MIKRKVAAALVGLSVAMFGAASGAHAQGKELVVATDTAFVPFEFKQGNTYTGFDVDLYVSTDLKTMTAIWMGAETTAAAQDAEKMVLTGDRDLARDIQTWLGLSPFARAMKPELVAIAR